MIQGFQRILRRITSKRNIRFINQKFLIPQKRLNLNYIPICNFGDNKRQYVIGSKDGILEFDQNMTFKQVSLEWQKEIHDQIKNFYEYKDNDQLFDTIFNIQDFVQFYLQHSYKESEQLIQIDKNILDFAEHMTELIQQLLQDKEIDPLELLGLKKHQIQIKFLLYFDSMKDPEKIQLLQLYQDLHQSTIEILPVNHGLQKMESYSQAEALSVYVAMQWAKNINESNKDYITKIFYYALVQIQQILEEVPRANEQNEFKVERFKYFTLKIQFLFEKYELFGAQTKQGTNFLFEFSNKNERIIENLKNILTAEEYKSQKLRSCINFIMLGYIEEALKSALSFIELRFKKTLFRFKAQNATSNLEELIQEIKNSSYDNDLAISHYNQLILLQQLHKLISEEKYNQLQSIIDQLINPINSDLSRFVMFPLFIEIIIRNPKIPNRDTYIECLITQLRSFQSSTHPSHYLHSQRELYALTLSLIANVEKDDKISTLLSASISDLFKTCHSENLKREGANLIFKLIPQIESPKTYKMLTEIIDSLIFQLQKDQQENKKWIEILDSQKIQLRQKYYKK